MIMMGDDGEWEEEELQYRGSIIHIRRDEVYQLILERERCIHALENGGNMIPKGA